MAGSTTRKCGYCDVPLPPTPISPCIQILLGNIPLDNNLWTANPGIIFPMLKKEEL